MIFFVAQCNASLITSSLVKLNQKTMKRALILIALVTTYSVFSQKKDTTRINVGDMEIMMISHADDNDFEVDTTDFSLWKNDKVNKNAHWAGVDLGFNVLMNASLASSFNNHPYWENDPGRSMTWNLNLFEHKFGRVLGFTTGLGLSFSQTAFKDNYVLINTVDTLYAEIDTIANYSQNKLRATYLIAPLLLDFCSIKKGGDGFYLAAGVVAGVRLASSIKRVGEMDGKEYRQKDKGPHGLNAFRLDATVRMGYADWGIFASYNIVPLFETVKTIAVYPLTFGLSFNL